jgi:sterol desaturase/sphingolipid hydroxylase (fatty acid hydroxylase superfamily)
MNSRLRNDLGKRAGVTSGLLGVLCVLAELCFLFPDLLVTRDALPFYKANLDVFRGILWTSIAATFVLGALSVLLLRSKTHGLLGMALGAVALLMRFTESVDTGAAEVSAGLDYFVLELLVLGLIFVPLERLYALHRQRIFRQGWQTDLKHFFVSHAGVQLLSFAVLIPAQTFFDWAVDFDFQARVAAQPLWLQFAEILLAADFVTYWVHRAFHQLPWLWHFHAIHHSSREMDWLAGSRMHLVDAMATRAAAFVPIFVLGFSQAALVAYVAFVSFHAVYIHSNTRWRFPVLRRVIATPEYHHWHHTSDEEGIDKNFAAFLPFWDWLFGTLHLPAHWPKKYGTVKFQPPESYLGQLAYPFQRKKETPYG